MWTQSEADASTTNNDVSAELQAIIDEMRVQDFDSIRFATYRAACKLRFIQKKTNVHLVDIWNMIEAFRENGMNAMPVHSQVKTSRLELLLTTIFHNLNKRLVASQHIDTDKSISLLLAFLLGAYDRQQTGRITVFSVKVALATLCAGKLVDKLRYIFSQISDASGIMEWERFNDYLQQVLALTAAVFEAPTFGFSEAAVNQCFQKDQKVTLNMFLDVFLSDPCPPCVMWLPLLHRMSSVENVYHPVVCDACQLCQNCFWRGRTSGTHSNEHEMKEYSSYKSPTKQLAHSIHKSLRCIPTSTNGRAAASQVYPERPPRQLDLTNAVPTTPGSLRRNPPDLQTWASSPQLLLPGHVGVGPSGLVDDEHKLIARYTAKLSGRASYPIGASTRSLATAAAANGFDDRALIAQLEEENAEMLREMARLENQGGSEDGQVSGLRERKAQLEEKMFVMQHRRRELMGQLEQLMSQLNTGPPIGGPSTAPSMSCLPDSLSGVGSRVANAFGAAPTGMSATSLQEDLLSAADRITDNMSHFVKELDLAHEGMLSNGVETN